MNENDNVNHPMHYATSMPTIQVECIDFAKKMNFCQGNAFKYVCEKIIKTNTSGELEYRISALDSIARQDYRSAVLCINEWKKEINVLFDDKK